MLVQPRHDLDEIAGLVADIELVFQDRVPTILDRAGRAGQGEQIGAAGHAGRGAALDRRSADLLKADPAKQLAEAGDILAVEPVQLLGRDVAAGDAGAAGAADAVDSDANDDPRTESEPLAT